MQDFPEFSANDTAIISDGNNPASLKAAVMPIARRPDLVFVRGQGSWLFDHTGKGYLDFIQGWAVNTLGHCHPAIVEAIQTQSQQLLNPSPAFYNQPMLQLANLLVNNSDFDQIFFANSGAEANEGAIKLARKWGSLHKQGAHKIISFNDGFHGRTLTTMAASGKSGWDSLFSPKTPGFIHVPFNDIEAVKAVIDDQTVAIMLEPIQGEAGVIPVQHVFLQQLRQLADQHQLLLILDEVQTGMGRTGSLFYYQQTGIVPDIMTLGKGIGGGVPLSALLCRSDISCFAFGDQGGTYNGNPLCCAAGLAVATILTREGFLPQVIQTGHYLRQQLQRLSTAFDLGEVRGSGLLLALDTGALEASSLAEQARAAGLLLNAPRNHCLRFMPALNVTTAEIDQMCGILESLMASMKF
jgi:acetylornithine/N-succinyldiaminopimelate aminotransferase